MCHFNFKGIYICTDRKPLTPEASIYQGPLPHTGNNQGELLNLSSMKLKEYDTECIRAAHAILATDPFRYKTIEGLALEVGLNRTKLQYGFKKLYGRSIDEYRVQVKMRIASKLLRQTDKSIKEIARLTGYKNISSFSVAFKRVFKTPPTQWRNNGW